MKESGDRFNNASIISRNVLLVNQNYEPLSVCNVKKAIILIYLGKAEMIVKDGCLIHSVTTTMDVPSVIRLVKFARTPRRKIILNRKNLLIRDHNRCQYCSRRVQPLTLDHIIPKQFGGKDTWENLVAACMPCNNRKANRTPEQAGMKLLSHPKRPNYLFYFQHFFGVSDERWKPFLFMK